MILLMAGHSMSAGRQGKTRLPTDDSLLVSTTRRLVPTERSDRRLGRSATRVKRPRNPGATAQVCGRLYMSIRRY